VSEIPRKGDLTQGPILRTLVLTWWLYAKGGWRKGLAG
jgi:hypothetical protein